MIRVLMAVVGLVVCGAAYVVATSKPAVAGADNTGVSWCLRFSAPSALWAGSSALARSSRIGERP